ncbi:hypothetical protein MMC28_000250 [Mycoblastus sanguinarius]|nr:hypothetical protein [Mycoblastus sanguinarius]
MRLYAFGSNGSGQLGIGSKDDTSIPKICLFNSEIPGQPSTIVAGGNHTLLLFDEGTLYSSGSPCDGKAPKESSLDSISIFQKSYISALDRKVKSCSALWDASVFVIVDTNHKNEENHVYTAGLGSKDEQDAGEFSASIGLHRLQQFPIDSPKIVDVASSVDHTVVVTPDGDVYGWGNGRKGQLDKPAEVVWAPRKFQKMGFRVVRAVCGRDFTYLVGEPSNGRHAVLGSDKWGTRSLAPASVPDWKEIGATWGSIFVLDSSGRLKSWGRNDHGQLAPPDLPLIEDLAAGSEHTVALTKEGQVISWGWGEHGNCGVDRDENGDVKGKWNKIPTEKYGKVLGIGAGCATSFFWTEYSESSTEDPCYRPC